MKFEISNDKLISLVNSMEKERLMIAVCMIAEAQYTLTEEFDVKVIKSLCAAFNKQNRKIGETGYFIGKDENNTYFVGKHISVNYPEISYFRNEEDAKITADILNKILKK